MTDREPGSWAGQQLGRYRLGRLIGRGSMGEVYEAEDTVRQRTIALKLLWADLSRDAGFRERMQREARTAGRLQEPHVVPIHDYGEIDGHLFLDMRLIQGSDLARVLKQSGPLNASRAVGLVTQAASALDAAHAVGVIHRDIKPAKLLLTADDFLYLVDFGIASAVGDEPLETPKTIEGTWKYAAPELFTGNDVGRGIDIYALTAVLYECLTGTPPYRADGVQALIGAHLNDPIPRASQAPGVAPAFDAVIARGLAKNTQDRYGTAGELARALHQAMNIPTPARPRPGVARPVLPVGPQQRHPASNPAPMTWPGPGWVPPPPPAPARSGYQPLAGSHPGVWRAPKQRGEHPSTGIGACTGPGLPPRPQRWCRSSP
jgi:serine/threonine-protein kinase